jgi:hypothetical protein
MNAKRHIQHLLASLLVAAALSTGTASAWDFDRTRAADIVDRAANDGDATAQLLLAMALDDRVNTIFDDLQFRLPATAVDDLFIQNLDPEEIYSGLMTAPGANKTKEGLMAYSLSGAYALAAGEYGKAVMYYRAAKTTGANLARQGGTKPDVTALAHDARAGEVAALRCSGKVPQQDTTYKIEKMLAGLHASEIAKDYRQFILRNVNKYPSMVSLDASDCWSASLPSATVVTPLAPYNYETNTSKYTGVLQ